MWLVTKTALASVYLGNLTAMNTKESPCIVDQRLAAFWQHMHQGCVSRESPWHLMCFSYIYEQRPHNATVVLRSSLEEQAIIGFNSDIRQKKCQAIEENPHICCLLYNKEEKLQWRIEGLCTVHHQDKIASEAWGEVPTGSRLCYTQDLTPGKVIEEQSQGYSPQRLLCRVKATQWQETYKNFARLNVHIQSLEWLHLHSQGHSRGIFKCDENGWQHHWLNP